MPYLSIREAAEEIRSGLITPTELVIEALERIAQVDDEIHAFVTIMRDEALKDAEKAELEIRTGFIRSPLHGIPVGIKDIIAVKDVRTTAGSKVLADHISQEDATVVEQLRRAGAIIIGKTNTHEFAYGTVTSPTRNPWNLDHIPGGSSGGSAAAIAAGMCLGAVGSDTGGSIRIPAACCGITGLKPTYGRVSCYGVIPLSWSLDHVGPMGRSAEDCAIMFDAIAMYDPKDPNSVAGPPSRSAALLIQGPEGGEPQSLQGLTLGRVPDSFVDPLDAEVRLAWQGAMLVLQEAGARLIDVDLPRPDVTIYRTIQQPEAALTHLEQSWLTEKLADYTEPTRAHLLAGQQIPAIDYLRAQHQRRAFTYAVRSVLDRVDALILPTMPFPAPSIEQIDHDILVNGIPTFILNLTFPFNLVGIPAVSFPCGFTSNNLPVGLQVVGKSFEEATVLRIAHGYQQLTDWHRREPDI